MAQQSIAKQNIARHGQNIAWIVCEYRLMFVVHMGFQVWFDSPFPYRVRGCLKLKKIRLRSASWTDLGSILTPKGVPKGSQIGSNMEPKWDRKTINK